MFMIILLIIHLILCVLVFLGIKFDILDVHNYMFFVALFVPFWGILIVLILHFQVAFDADGTKEIQMEKMRIDSEIYKSITVDEKNNASTVVPMEEALIINSARERRELIMDVLNDNPKEYIEFLQKAGNNDDTEVVHYAVTAMVEISKENDYIMQQFERKYSENPDDYEVLTQYSDFLWSCLEQNLMQGQVEIMNRNVFNQLILKKIRVKEIFDDYGRFAKNCMKLGEYTAAGEAISHMERLEPDNEELVILKLNYYAALNRGNDINKLIEELEQNKTYLSPAIKETLAFWKE